MNRTNTSLKFTPRLRQHCSLLICIHSPRFLLRTAPQYSVMVAEFQLLWSHHHAGCMGHCTERQVEIWKVRVLMLVSIMFRYLFVRDELTREWRKLHNEELSDLYSSPNIFREIKSRKMKWAGHVARVREKWGVYGVLLGKPEGKRPIGRPRCRWEDNIK